MAFPPSKSSPVWNPGSTQPVRPRRTAADGVQSQLQRSGRAGSEALFDFALQRELDSETGDLDIPARALQAIRDGIRFLEASPSACRKAGSSPFLRELIIPFGRTGYVVLFEIVGAVRHQREDDDH